MKKGRYKLKYTNIFLTLVFLLVIGIIIYTLFFSTDYNYKMPSEAIITNHDYDLDEFKGKNIKSYEDDKYYSRFGLDVSTFQKEINFNSLALNGVEFVYIRLGYRGYGKGDIHLDDMFEANYKKAKEAGLEVGVYFYSQAINDHEAIDEAYFVIDHLKGKDIDLEVVYDLEIPASKDARTRNLDVETKTRCAVAFLEKIKEYHYQPMLYVNLDFINNHYNMNYLTNYPIWFAQYDQLPLIQMPFKMWQYTDKGKITGIDTKVDFNIRLEEK